MTFANRAALILVVCLSAFPTVVFGHEIGARHGASHETHDSGSHPELVASGATEARQLLNAFRRSGDDTFLDRAWAALEPVLREPVSSAWPLIDAAAIAQARHQFARSLRYLERALALDPGNEQAWLMSATVHLVVGRQAEAARACAELTRASLIVSVGCRSRVELAGEYAGPAGRQLLALLTARQQFAATASDTEPVIAWAWSIAGDLMAASGEPLKAIRFYERSIAILENAQVRAAMVDTLISQESWQEAALALDGREALPLKVRRHIVDKALQRADSRAIEQMDREFEAWVNAEDWLHAREMARFYIDVVERPLLARRLATINATLQQEREDRVLERRTRNAAAGRS